MKDEQKRREEEQERVTDRQSNEQVKIRLNKIAILPCQKYFRVAQ
jgi:hypothetical protein